jgi:hypothetical protein
MDARGVTMALGGVGDAKNGVGSTLLLATNET